MRKLSDEEKAELQKKIQQTKQEQWEITERKVVGKKKRGTEVLWVVIGAVVFSVATIPLSVMAWGLVVLYWADVFSNFQSFFVNSALVVIVVVGCVVGAYLGRFIGKKASRENGAKVALFVPLVFIALAIMFFIEMVRNGGIGN